MKNTLLLLEDLWTKQCKAICIKGNTTFQFPRIIMHIFLQFDSDLRGGSGVPPCGQGFQMQGWSPGQRKRKKVSRKGGSLFSLSLHSTPIPLNQPRRQGAPPTSIKKQPSSGARQENQKWAQLITYQKAEEGVEWTELTFVSPQREKRGQVFWSRQNWLSGDLSPFPRFGHEGLMCTLSLI